LSRPSRRAAVDAALVGTVLMWAVNFSVVKAALRHFPPMAFTTIRLAGASLCFLAIARLSPGPSLLPSDRKRLVLLALVGHTLYQVLFIQGIHATTASNSAILLGLTPVFVALLSLFLSPDPPRAGAFVGIGISILGVYLVLHDSSRTGGGVLGDLLTLAATFCWSLHTVLSQPIVARYGPLRTSAYAITLGSLFFLPLGLPELSRMTPASVPAAAWWGLGYSIVFSLVAAYGLWYYAVGRIGPTETAIYSNLTPVAAMIVAYLALDEPVGRRKLVGAAVIFLGIYLVRRQSTRPRLDPVGGKPLA
jgi:drug/metabolite transporter (DMT)-like permease